MTKKNIQEISDTKQCYGCDLCGDICHTSAISFHEDYEGFLYPQVDNDLCTMCTECYRKCPVNNDKEKENFLHPEVYAAWHKDEKVVSQSTSGGVFTAISEYIFNKNGVVFGAKFNENMELVHMKASNQEEMAKMRGSKYLQSNLEGVYKEMKIELKKGTDVLFVGLPCQTAAVKTYFGKYKNLLLVDIICHGINSPGVFKQYTNYIETKYNGKLQSYNFRNKTNGWVVPKIKAEFNTGNYESIFDMDSFSAGFRKNLYLRECCFECKYTKEQRGGDFTIGDFWGVPDELYNRDGVSLVLVNSEKAKEVYRKIEKNLVSSKSEFEISKKKNPQLERPSSISEKNRQMRKDFFILLQQGKSKEAFDTFIFGKPFPLLRKWRYFFRYHKRRLELKIK